MRVPIQNLQDQIYLKIYWYPNPEQEFNPIQDVSGTHQCTTQEAAVPAKKSGEGFMVRKMASGTAGCAWFDKLEALMEEKK